MVPEGKISWKKRIIDELRKLSITVIYIWVLLSVFTLHREVILASKVRLCLHQCRDPREVYVVGRNTTCREEGCWQSPAVFDALELCSFCRHFDGLPSSRGGFAQVVAWTIYRG